MRITGRLRASFLHSPIQRTKVIKLAKFAAHPGPGLHKDRTPAAHPPRSGPPRPYGHCAGQKDSGYRRWPGRVPSYPFR